MSEVALLAEFHGISGRTLRRWVDNGLVRGRKPSPRRLELPAEEWRFLQRHVPLLVALRRAIRTERRLQTAVLFGSVARGDDSPESDVDVLVSARESEGLYSLELAGRLSEAAGRDVGVTLLRDVREEAAFLAEVLRDGRVLVDRAGEWRRLMRTKPQIEARARNADRELLRRAWGAVEALESIRQG